MNWQEKFVPDPESCVALFTMGLPQKETTFVWVDQLMVNHQGHATYRLLRRAEIADIQRGVFAAYTAEEFQTILPVNFIPMRNEKLGFMIVDLYGTKINTSENDDKKVKTQGVVMSRVNGSNALTLAQAWANAAIFLIQTGALKTK